MSKFELKSESKKTKNCVLPKTGIDDISGNLPTKYRRTDDIDFKSLSEREVTEHFKAMFSGNESAGEGHKYMRSVLAEISRYDGYIGAHPYQLQDASQGALELLFNLRHMFCDMFGMDAFCTQSSAANGIFTALRVIKAYCKKNGNDRNIILVSERIDSDSVTQIESFGYVCKVINFDKRSVQKEANNLVAGAVWNMPRDNGAFAADIEEINKILHNCGSLACCEANAMSALLGIARPGDMGFDMAYFNIENVFEISNCDGASDCAAFGVKDFLAGFMPVPVIEIDNEEQYYLNFNIRDSIGKVNDFYGDFISLAKTLAYILSMGYDGLKETSYINALKDYKAKTNCEKTQ